MRTASCLTLIAVGAIFTFAITSSPSFLNLQIAGVIIMLDRRRRPGSARPARAGCAAGRSCGGLRAGRWSAPSTSSATRRM